ncbi:uncharacterized protein LOC132731251 [Ruditapes philippinarum]|uniref:uncharacterized protein LOC132731251 n=1 Tax=Ruditapes philippinarum TaxID=129788 RepID=UPI00295B4A39|nr:uncharacterized protein LOC132731251 [Ruditapes philippinarum]
MAVRKRYFVWREHHVADPICDTYQAQYLQNHCSELLVSLWTVENDCTCQESLCFYLKFAPSLIFRWKRSGSFPSIGVKKLMSDLVQHLTVWGAPTFTYKEVNFLRSCKQLKSVSFKNFNLFSKYYCCEEDLDDDDDSDDDNNSENHSKKHCLSLKSSVESVKASLGSDDIQFLLSDRFFDSSIKRLNIISYENIISVCQLHGKGWCNKALRKLTHLTLTGEILSECLVEELIDSLFVVYR